MRILIAEDDSFQRALLKRILGKWGHEVEEAENGMEAIAKIRKDRFSVVITDWMMPEMDGIELVRQIRKIPHLEYIYIIIMTAKTEKDDMFEGMEAGADDFISKPLDQKELTVRLRAGERIVQLEEELSRHNRELQEANEKMKQNMEAAAKVQRSLLPSALPDVPGLNIDWRIKPYQDLAGDTLNVFHLDDLYLGLYILDVSGHGVTAALLAVTLSRILSPIAGQSTLLWRPKKEGKGHLISSPSWVAEQLNSQFQFNLKNQQFFTMVYGILNKESKEFRYISAGHPGLIYIGRGSKPKLLDVRSLPIGFSNSPGYQEQVIRLHQGDRIYLYSDGIIEALNSEEKPFGVRGVVESLQALSELSLAESLEGLLSRVEAWSEKSSFHDDVTLLSLEVRTDL